MILTPAQEAVLLALPMDQRHATTIGALAFRLGRDERAVREAIKELRERWNVAIVTLPTSRGVWLTETPAELESVIACQQSRLDSLSRSISRLKRLRDAMQYSPTLFGAEG